MRKTLKEGMPMLTRRLYNTPKPTWPPGATSLGPGLPRSERDATTLANPNTPFPTRTVGECRRGLSPGFPAAFWQIQIRPKRKSSNSGSQVCDDSTPFLGLCYGHGYIEIGRESLPGRFFTQRIGQTIAYEISEVPGLLGLTSAPVRLGLTHAK